MFQKERSQHNVLDGIRSELKEKQYRDKKVFGYVNELREMEVAPAEKGTTKNLFFSNMYGEANRESMRPAGFQKFARQPLVGRASLVPIDITKVDKSQGPKSFVVTRATKLGEFRPQQPQVTNFTRIGDIHARITLMQVKTKVSVLQNVNADDISEEEHTIFKRVSIMLEKHLAENTNLFHILFKKFQVYFITKYEPILDEIKLKYDPLRLGEDDEKALADVLNILTQEILEFIRIQVKCLILFYNFDICYFRVDSKELNRVTYLPCTILNFDHLMNFTTAIMFPKRIYELVVEYFQFKNQAKILKLKTKLNSLQDVITMNNLEISEKFQLRRRTNLTEKDRLRAQTSYSQEFGEKDLEHESGSPQSNPRKSKPDDWERKEVRRRLVNSISGNQATIPEDIADDPYQSAIHSLRLIDDVDSPLEKMKVLLAVIRKITKAINDYYVKETGKKEVLTGDQTMGLVVYVVLRAKSENLLAYVEYIQAFLPPRMLGTFCGYYLTVFQAACEYIAEFEEPAEARKSSSGQVN